MYYEYCICFNILIYLLVLLSMPQSKGILHFHTQEVLLFNRQKNRNRNNFYFIFIVLLYILLLNYFMTDSFCESNNLIVTDCETKFFNNSILLRIIAIL